MRIDATRRTLCALLAVVLALAGASRAAQPSVPYVPTPQTVVERMLEMGKVGSHDYLIDLGSGDGRIVVTAAMKYGTRGFGVDLNPVRIAEANENARKAGVADKVAFYERDLFETDLSAATVITMYLLPQVNLRLRPVVLGLKPGTRIVSHDFSMDDWRPDAHVEMHAPDKYGGSGGISDIYLWIVPAKLGGTWRWQIALPGGGASYELDVTQRYQAVSGTVRVDGDTVAVEDATVSGDTFSFGFTAKVGGRAIAHRVSARVQGDSMYGTVTLAGTQLQSERQWEATRVAAPAEAAR